MVAVPIERAGIRGCGIREGGNAGEGRTTRVGAFERRSYTFTADDRRRKSLQATKVFDTLSTRFPPSFRQISHRIAGRFTRNRAEICAELSRLLAWTRDSPDRSPRYSSSECTSRQPARQFVFSKHPIHAQPYPRHAFFSWTTASR